MAQAVADAGFPALAQGVAQCHGRWAPPRAMEFRQNAASSRRAALPVPSALWTQHTCAARRSFGDGAQDGYFCAYIGEGLESVKGLHCS